MPQIAIIVAEDSDLFRKLIIEKLQEVPDLTVVAESTNGQDLPELITQKKPDIVLSDVSMPGYNVTSAIINIKKQFPDVKVAVLSGEVNVIFIRHLLQQGACGYFYKGDDLSQCAKSVPEMVKGQILFSPSVQKQLDSDPETTS